MKRHECHAKEVSIVYINQELPTSVDPDPFSHQGFLAGPGGILWDQSPLETEAC